MMGTKDRNYEAEAKILEEEISELKTDVHDFRAALLAVESLKSKEDDKHELEEINNFLEAM